MLRDPRWLLVCALLASCGDDGGTGEASTATDASTASTSTAGSTLEPTTLEPTTIGSDPTATGGELDILAALQAIDGLTVEELDPKIEGYRAFALTFSQPADHDDPGGQKFAQRMTLLHRDLAAPLVLSTDGYDIVPTSQKLSEPAVLLHANQLRVEHRFFEASRPEPADWSTLTIAQAAADHHRIVEVLRPIYGAAWLSTGVSKGGMTAVFHRRFYPDDVDATVAYVAPLSHGIADPRYNDFLQKIGDPACRQAVVDFQRELLLRRPQILARIDAEAVDFELTYDLLTPDRALDIIALETPFAFWQYLGAGSCAQVPGAMASDDEVWDFLSVVNPPYLWSDDILRTFEPYYWQAARQLGTYAVDESAVADLLMFPGEDVPQTFIFGGKQPAFDAAAMDDIAAWVAGAATRVLFIYGATDPWSAGAFELGDADDVHRLFVAGGNHNSKIADLAAPDRDLAHARLEAWTGVTPSARALPHEPALRPRAAMVP